VPHILGIIGPNIEQGRVKNILSVDI